MADPHAPLNHDTDAARRRRVRRTAWWLAGLAVAVYIGFMLLGVLSQ